MDLTHKYELKSKRKNATKDHTMQIKNWTQKKLRNQINQEKYY